ncbi:MAG: FkbM family methyltransferase [Planctomycetota bacterium]
MGQNWYDCDWGRLTELDLLGTGKLHPGATVFDLGSHQGVVALVLASLVGQDGKVVAVEANDINVDVSRTNALENGFGNIELVHAAVGSDSEEKRITISLNSRLASGNDREATVSVPGVTLESLVSDHGKPDVVLLDVEGAEWDALQGAGAVFDGQDRPDVFVEVHANGPLEVFGGRADDVVKFFEERGYRLFYAMEAPHLEPLDFVPMSADSRPGHGRFFLVALGL